MSQEEIDRAERPDPEVKPTASRRRFSAKEKLRILEEADACTEPGQIGALVRREGIYSSYLSRWRRARDRGELGGLSGKKRGPKRTVSQEQKEEIAALRRENERLRARLEQAETIIEVQKKLSAMLGLETPAKESQARRPGRGRRAERPSRRASTWLHWSARWFQPTKRAFSSLNWSPSCVKIIDTYQTLVVRVRKGWAVVECDTCGEVVEEADPFPREEAAIRY